MTLVEDVENVLIIRREEVTELPQTLSPHHLASGMRAVSLLLRNCTGSQARVRLDLVVSGETGRASRVHVRGDLAGSAEGSCVERAVRRAQFPRFTETQFEIRDYPLVVR